jgi:hypothetical protein
MAFTLEVYYPQLCTHLLLPHARNISHAPDQSYRCLCLLCAFTFLGLTIWNRRTVATNETWGALSHQHCSPVRYKCDTQLPPFCDITKNVICRLLCAGQSCCIRADRLHDEEEAICPEYTKGHMYSHLTHVTASRPARRPETRVLTLAK